MIHLIICFGILRLSTINFVRSLVSVREYIESLALVRCDPVLVVVVLLLMIIIELYDRAVIFMLFEASYRYTNVFFLPVLD